MSENYTISFEKALHKAAVYCSSSERCISDLKDRFESWQVKDADRQKIIDYLITEKYIDEKRYATAYAKDKFRYNKWGKIKINLQLKAKQIDDEIIREALNNIDEDDYIEMVRKLTKDKLKHISYQNEYEKKAKLVRFLTSKGFESGIVFKVLDELAQ